MLSEKTDDDAEDGRRNSNENRGVSQTSVLSQLLSNSNGPNNGRSQASDNDSYLERIGGIKRKFDEAKAMTLNIKRATPENQQVRLLGYKSYKTFSSSWANFCGSRSFAKFLSSYNLYVQLVLLHCIDKFNSK